MSCILYNAGADDLAILHGNIINLDLYGTHLISLFYSESDDVLPALYGNRCHHILAVGQVHSLEVVLGPLGTVRVVLQYSIGPQNKVSPFTNLYINVHGNG